MLALLDRLNLSPSERRLVVLVLVVAFIVVNYWLVWPRFREWGIVRDQMQDSRQKLDRYQREADRLPTYETTLRKLQGEGSSVPRGEEAIHFLSSMQRLAFDSRVQVSVWGQVTTPRVTGAATNSFFDEKTLTIRATCGEPELVNFLYRLGASNSAVRVRELVLSPGINDPRSGGSTNLATTITLVASYQKNPGGAATNNPARPTPTMAHR